MEKPIKYTTKFHISLCTEVFYLQGELTINFFLPEKEAEK